MKQFIYVSITFISFFSLFACASPIETIPINEKQLILETKTCKITLDKQSLFLGMKPNCLFIKENNESTKIKSYYYKDIQSHVFIVVGGTHQSDPDRPFTHTRTDCGNQTQAIIIKNNIAILSPRISEGLSCAGLGSDEKEFHILSHP